ncbi:ComEC/Rec2 family competence protein [Natrononativus amylolyticus]|uniref:ComEC/Rec2 family competence protein n=1 Tax=Natrononativus amylolyticus TaxID=2963434 RepID=UPI0020CF689A|nr:ComEC/Rec2 family competence protein [Natrononativus amylolyticus]
MRRTVLVVLVAALVALAGCSGETGPEPDNESAPDDADDLESAHAEADGNGDETDDGDDETAESGDETDDGDDETAESGDETDSQEADDDRETDEDGDGGTDTDESGTDDSSADAHAVDGELEIHHIDVGQADAALLIEPSGETMLIDTGDWRQDGSGVISSLEAQGVDRIDHLVATHAHADHIGGHAAVIEHYETEGDGVDAAYDSGVAHTSQTYESYLDAVEDHDVTLYEVQEGDSVAFGDAHVEFYNPPAGDSGTDLHYNSVALTVAFGEVTYLTTGDAEDGAEARMVDAYGDDLAADVYQAGHHGSSTSSTAPFLDAVDPSVAVISSAYGSQYGHPHDEVLESFGDRGIETYWTGVHGAVVVTTDGETVAVEPASEGPTDGSELIDEKPADDDDTAALIHPAVDVTGAPTTG